MKITALYLILKRNLNVIVRIIMAFFFCFLPAITMYLTIEYNQLIFWTALFVVTPLVYGIGLPYSFAKWFKFPKISIFFLGLLSVCLLLKVTTLVGQHGIVSEALLAQFYTFMFMMNFSCGLIWRMNNNLFQILATFWYFITFMCNIICLLFFLVEM